MSSFDLIERTLQTNTALQCWSSPTQNPLYRVILQCGGHEPSSVDCIWKDTDQQAVIRTDKAYYKIYQLSDDGSWSFPSMVREVLGKIYNDMGIKWHVRTVKTKQGSVYQVEQRQPLTVCQSDLVSFEKLFYNYTSVHKRLEKALKLDKIASCLQGIVPRLSQLHLVRDCYNKHEDYAFDEKGNVILLDDSDWFLAVVDDGGDWISPPYDFYEFKINGKLYTFCPLTWDKDVDDPNRETLYDSNVDKWTLVEGQVAAAKTIDTVKNKFASIKRQMLFDNIQALQDKQVDKMLVMLE